MPPKRAAAKKAAQPSTQELPEYMALPASGSEDESESESDGGAESEDGDGEKPEKPVVDAKTLKKAKQQIAKAEGSGERGVVYLGNIPFGFYEEEMKAFFNQFGTVTRLRMSRSKKTGRSRGYAFIEFKDKEVADIVAETMNNYLMFNRLLKCQVIPAERVHEETFKNAHRAFRQMDWRKFEQRRHNKARDAQQTEKVVKRLVNNEKKTRAKLQKLGIDYDFPGYEGSASSAKAKQAPAPTPKSSEKPSAQAPTKASQKQAPTPAAAKPKAEAKSAAKSTPAQSKAKAGGKPTPKPAATPAGAKRKADGPPATSGKKAKK